MPSLTSPEPVKPGAVPGQRQADAGGDAGAIGPALADGARLRPACRSNSAASAARSSTSSRRRSRAGPGRSASCRPRGSPAAAQLERRQAERLRDAVDLHLGRELGLRRAEAAEGAVGRRVGRHRAARDPHVRAPIRTAGMQHAAADSTTGVSVQYAPPSMITSMSWATSSPSRRRPSGCGRWPGVAWSWRRCPRGGRRSSAPACGTSAPAARRGGR